MILVVGLGNPGKKFKKTRHNLGFRVIKEFSKRSNFPKFKLSKKYNSLISEEISNGEKIILAMPQTFMNESGKAVKLLTKTYTLDSNNLIIIHDDIDLPLGKIRISVGRGSAGHKGVQSIIDRLGTKNFVRFRVGIRPQETKNRKQKIEKFVLKKINKEEEKILKKVIKRTCQALKMALKESLEKAMSEFNK